MKKFYTLVLMLLFIFGFSQKGELRKVATVGFLNVENMWDTIQSADYIDGTKAISNPAFHRSIPIDSIKFLAHEEYDGPWNDYALKGKKVVRLQGSSDEFTPSSPKNYGKKIYEEKLHNIAKVISQIGAQYTKTAPVVVGLIEVENRKVVEDIAHYPTLAKYDYGIIHFNSYDYRGIDVALLYQKRRFTPTNALKKEIKIFNEDGKQQYTRDIIVLTGFLDNEKVAFFMNHWPSRLGGEAVSLPKRNKAGDVLKKEMDSVRALDPSTKLFAMGDFNDDPVSPSIKDHLGAVGDIKDVTPDRPYVDLMYPLYKKGVASLAYRDSPNLFDQIIVSSNLISDKVGKEYSVYKAEIFAPSYLINKTGSFKGYPFRSWNGDQFTGGYSDHFPAFVVLQREYNPK
ncbi:endonuclease [Halpernia sp.]|uniref:endonuclease/exonuclease/phosphatase family protein n=1 Tax=Halpernia sp. TaxID=2782209 RepID=UPI003A8D991D